MRDLSQEDPTHLACSMSLLQVSDDAANDIHRAFGVWKAYAPTSRFPEALSESKLIGMTACLYPIKVRQAYFTDIRTLGLFDHP
jgi:hypothetical protein